MIKIVFVFLLLSTTKQTEAKLNFAGLKPNYKEEETRKFLRPSFYFPIKQKTRIFFF